MKQKTISASYLKMFLQCTQKFYYRYHTDKQPIVNGEARAFGTAIHEAMEHMYTILSGDRVPTEEDYVSVCDVFIKSGIKNNLCDQNLYDEGRLLLKQRIDDYAPIKGLLVLELKFGWGEGYPQVCTPNGTPIMGAMDKVYELTPTTVVVEDYKTSRVALTDEELQKDEQLSMYDYAV